MPSRSSSAHIIGALLAATGLAIALIGLLQSNKLDQSTGLALAAIGSMPLFVLAYRVNRSEAAIRDIDAHRAEIQGEAFSLALELVRTGQLNGNPTDSTINPASSQ